MTDDDLARREVDARDQDMAFPSDVLVRIAEVRRVRAALAAGSDLRRTVQIRTSGEGINRRQPRIPSVDRALLAWDRATDREIA